MRVFLASIVAAIVVSVGAMYVVNEYWQQTADQAFTSTTNVRFPHEENGHNLVGKDWTSAKDH
jgi:hypothetical protein